MTLNQDYHRPDVQRAIMTSNHDYPRPDFQRPGLHWQSLNGQWDFIFDDLDVGLSQQWQHNGIPAEVAVGGSAADVYQANPESQSITKRIAAMPGNLLQDNRHTQDTSQLQSKRKIEVPYVFQCPASGIGERGVHEVLWYETTIQDFRSQVDGYCSAGMILRFGAVDYDCKVWLDGHYVGSHRGGHVPFDIDITDVLDDVRDRDRDVARLTIRVYDSAFDLTQPRGKQYWGAQPESIFYTPSGGIWQSVWLEALPRTRIADSSHGTFLRSNDIESGELHATIAILGRRSGQEYSVEVEADLAGLTIAQSARKPLSREVDYVKLDQRLYIYDPDIVTAAAAALGVSTDDASAWRNGVALWSPEHPSLYDLTIRLFASNGDLLDTVNTQIGMRSVGWSLGDSTFRLNGSPLFQALNLDQGYWADTFMTPPSSDALKHDIVIAKEMGFNGCRKHQKVEDPRFLYWADKLGYLVWGEMANAYQFSEAYVERFNEEWAAAVKRDINHACIVAWTPINESWGYTDLKNNNQQRDHIRALYYMTKALDPTRPINDNCGWEHVQTDLSTFHDYSDTPELAKTCATLESILDVKAGRDVFVGGSKHVDGAPVLCTEFGGVNIAPADSSKKGERDWGYTTASNPRDLLERVEKLVKAVVEGGHSCGFVYTQLTDIEQEVNGLYTIAREPKLDPAMVKAVMQTAQETYHSRLHRA